MYELTFLINPNIAEEEIGNFVGQIRERIINASGTITKDFFSKKIYLAYPIKKMRQAFFVSAEFEINGENLKLIENNIKENKNILRYLIVVKQIKEVKSKAPKPFKAKSAKSKPKEKVKIAELDKKLEEILEA